MYQQTARRTNLIGLAGQNRADGIAPHLRMMMMRRGMLLTALYSARRRHILDCLQSHGLRLAPEATTILDLRAARPMNGTGSSTSKRRCALRYLVGAVARMR